jgi:ERCC4-type nuclease
MLLKIDVREKDLIIHLKGLIETGLFKDKDIKLIIDTLPLGDIIISSDENEDLLIIERKAINDLLCSIKDGRYEEQSYRLSGSEIHNHNIIYLIEGNINSTHHFKCTKNIEKTIFYSSLFSLNYYKGFSVLRTINIEETALFICNTVNKIKKGLVEKKEPYYKNIHLDVNSIHENEISKPTDVETSETLIGSIIPYVNVVKKVKKENINPENIGEIILSQIPGLSSITATAIMKNYHSISDLVTALKENNNCLENFKYETKNGQERKINKTCIKNIYNYLFNK